ncbi:MAG: ATP-dependent DNA helicase RecQ, partial [Candidatus Eremiobacteraeota bacterium]|nr:ATP-dependent DNA helicase RecQ [Candidatus Eremiobacteraeota bacterium]
VRDRVADADAAMVQHALIGDRPVRESQHAVLQRLEKGKNTLAVLGTGRGKSFCFQYPAAIRALDGAQKTIAVYPLRALANDQYEAVRRRFDGFGLRIFRANGSIDAEERTSLFNALADGTWDLIFATPEFLQFHRDAFSQSSRPSLIVIDEAHHLFESKHRVAYGRIASVIAELDNPQVLALTATAGDDAFAQITRELAIESWVIDPTVRDNLRIVDARETSNKVAYLRELFADPGRAIVYCNARDDTVKVADELRKTFGNEIVYYHAGLGHEERLGVEQYFREGGVRVVVATTAFGEGIDLPDIRNVVLYHMNFNFTEFNQQAGRAGRDDAPARIHLLFGEKDRGLNEYLIDSQAPTLTTLREIYKGVRGLSRNGVVRMPAVEIARALDIPRTNERTIGAALRIFEEANLIDVGNDEDGRFIRVLPTDGRHIELAKNERFAEGEAERENFARFAEFALKRSPETLEAVINRPIYPRHVALQK